MSDSDGEQPETVQVLARELSRVVEPILHLPRMDVKGMAVLFDEMGLGEQLLDEEFEKIAGQIESEIADPLSQLEGVLSDIQEGKTPSPDDAINVVDDVTRVVEGVRTLSDLQFQSIDPAELADNVVDYLLVRYLHDYHRELHNWLAITGVVVETPGGPPELRPEKIPELLSDPGALAAEAFGWNTESFDAVMVLSYFVDVFWDHNVPATLESVSNEQLKQLGEWQSVEDVPAVPNLSEQLRIPVLTLQGEDGFGSIGLKMVPLPATNDELPGLAIVPFGTGAVGFGEEVDLGDDWTFGVDVTGSGSISGWGLAIRPDDETGISAQLRDLKEGSNVDVSIEGEAELVYHGTDEDGDRTVLFGKPGGSRVALGSLAARTRVKYDGDTVVFEFAVPASGTIAVGGDDGDGFLQKVLPEDGITYDFETLVGWSSERGLFFEQGGTLEASIALEEALGPLTMQEVYLAIASELEGEGGDGASGDGPPALQVPVGSSFALDIGFLTATVQRIGVEADVSFPGLASGGGDGGPPIELDAAFKPPNGIGLGVDAGPVSGGGVLNFYPDDHRYSGALQLQFGEYTLTAVGLLKTKLPGGQDGFSFLLLITAELPPIQLGFGFTLTGVGGLFGLHRKFKSKPLGKAIRAGNVDSVLFPEDVVENADRIISDLRSIFPPTRGQHVVGPMVQLNWGTPTVLTMEVGVILQLPAFKIGLVGNFALALPDEEAALIELNLAVLGVLDLPNRRLSIDASLYDSRIVAWTVSGDMAMRLRWGDDARFVLSIGGWHPRFDPPDNFPKLDRVKASLSPPGGNPRLEYKGYLATTPNTFQVGAGVYLHASAGPAKVDGELSFDALFQFDPFKFIVDFLARLAVKISGHGLDIKVDGSLSGPEPWRVKGTVHIEILFIEVTADVDVKIGDGGGKEELPAATILPKLSDELGKPGNWSAQLPKNGSSVASIRRPGDDEEDGGRAGGPSEVLAHPLGGISVRQTVVPLGSTIEKFGNARPSTHDAFRIASVSVDGAEVESLAPNTERFSPAQFREMKDSEKLSSPAFVEREAGRRVDGNRLYYGSQPVDAYAGETVDEDASTGEWRTGARLEYETTVIDEREEQPAAPLASIGPFAGRRPEVARFGVPIDVLEEQLRRSAIGKTEAKIRGEFSDRSPGTYGTPQGTVMGKRRTELGNRGWEADEAETMPRDHGGTPGGTGGTGGGVIGGDDGVIGGPGGGVIGDGDFGGPGGGAVGGVGGDIGGYGGQTGPQTRLQEALENEAVGDQVTQAEGSGSLLDDSNGVTNFGGGDGGN